MELLPLISYGLEKEERSIPVFGGKNLELVAANPARFTASKAYVLKKLFTMMLHRPQGPARNYFFNQQTSAGATLNFTDTAVEGDSAFGIHVSISVGDNASGVLQFNVTSTKPAVGLAGTTTQLAQSIVVKPTARDSSFILLYAEPDQESKVHPVMCEAGYLVGPPIESSVQVAAINPPTGTVIRVDALNSAHPVVQKFFEQAVASKIMQLA